MAVLTNRAGPRGKYVQSANTVTQFMTFLHNLLVFHSLKASIAQFVVKYWSETSVEVEMRQCVAAAEMASRGRHLARPGGEGTPC